MARIEQHDPDEPMTLDEAVQSVFRGAITPASLHAEHKRGNLDMYKIGRRWFVTLRDLREMQKKCRVKAEKPKESGSGSSRTDTTGRRESSPSDPYGSSATDRASVARDAALLTAKELSSSLQSTSRAATTRKTSKALRLIKS